MSDKNLACCSIPRYRAIVADEELERQAKAEAEQKCYPSLKWARNR
jgi:hypothetical protein